MPDSQGSQSAAVSLGTLAITLLARTKAFRDGMGRAINVLQKFNAEAVKQQAAFAGMAKSVVASVRETTNAVTSGAKQTQKAMAAVRGQGKASAEQVKVTAKSGLRWGQMMRGSEKESRFSVSKTAKTVVQATNQIKKAVITTGDEYRASAQKVQASGKQVRSSIMKTAQTVDQGTKRVMSRGKQQLGAILSFQEGVSKFIKMNVRWFVVWRSFWFLWIKLQEAMANINVLIHETSLALRTSADALDNEVELLVKRNALTKEAIRFTAQHTKTLREYIKSFYYLTTAGLTWNVAQETIDTTMETSIALDEDAIQTTRTLTSLYNVFGKTLTTARTPLEKMQKISAILTATFRHQDIEMKDYNKAMTYVGALSKTAGVSLEVLVASLGVLGTHLVKSGKGGTALARTFARLLRYPERLAKVTGYAFDPTKPLQFEQAMRLIGEELREAASGSDEFGVNTRKAAEMIDLLGLRGIRVITLAENFEKLAEQIKINRAATYDLVESMVALVESDPSAQLKILGNAISMNIVAMVRGAMQTQSFSLQLASLNKILLKAIGLSEDLGRTVGILLGSLEKIPAALIAWRLASTKAAAPTSVLGKWFQGLGLSLLVVWRALTKTKINQHVVKLGAALGYVAKDFTKLIPAMKGAGLAVGRFTVILGGVLVVFDLLRTGWEIATGSFTKRSEQFAFEQVAIHKGWLSKLASFFNVRHQLYKVESFWLTKQWERDRRIYEEALEEEGLTKEQHQQKMTEFLVEWWSKALETDETQLKKKMGIYSAADEALMAERVRIENETQKEIRKAQLSGLEYELTNLDQRIQVMKAKGVEANLIETYYELKREAIFTKSLKGISKKFKETFDTLLGIQKNSLDKELDDAQKAGVKLEDLYAHQYLTRVRMGFDAGTEEAKILSNAMRALEDETLHGMLAIDLVRIQAAAWGADELSEILAESAIKERGLQLSKAAATIRIENKALDTLKKLIKKNSDFRLKERIAGGKKDLDVLKQNFEKRKTLNEEGLEKITGSTLASEELRKDATKVYQAGLRRLTARNAEEQSEIVVYWAKKRADALAKIDAKDFNRVESAWVGLAKRISDIHEKNLEIIEKQRAVSTEKEISDEQERIDVLAGLAADEAKSATSATEALDRLKIKRASEYFKYLIQLKKKEVKEVEEGDQEIADSSNITWLSILAGVNDASKNYIKRAGDLSDSVKRIFGQLYQDLENVISTSLQRMLGLEEESSRESLELITERNEERRKKLREDLEEGVISRERYYLELGELDRKFTEEVENRRRGFAKNMGDLWKSMQTTALAEFSKMVVGIIAESIKLFAAEKAITTAIISENLAKGISSIWGWVMKIPWGWPIGLALTAALTAKFAGLFRPSLAKGGIVENATTALIGEAGPEAVIPLSRRGGKLGLSDRGRDILQPLLGLERTVPSLLRSASQSTGLLQLSPEAAATLGGRTAVQKTDQKVDISLTFEGDTIDFSGSLPMINDVTTIDKIYDEVWLPAKQRRIARLKDTIGEIIE